MLQLLTTDVFASWFSALDDAAAEDVATALEVVAELGPAKAPPESRESLLWYEHPTVSQFQSLESLAWDLEAWGAFHDYARRVIDKLESPKFAARLAELGAQETRTVLRAVRGIKRAIDPRYRWTLKITKGGHPTLSAHAEAASETVRRLYFDALEAAGFALSDVPPHSRALRELANRRRGPGFRLLYGVDVERETALFVLGEWLDRSFYGDSVRRAERMWKDYQDGQLAAVSPAAAAR
jgi:hypothetical protein